MGLREHEVHEYWKNRANLQGVNTPGPGGMSLNQQEQTYQERYAFIEPKFPFCSFNVLDYGCGIGRYSGLCRKDKYTGVDITKALWEIAISRMPDHKFYLLKHPFFGEKEDIPKDHNAFFTATVLQHCSDLLVSKILKTAVPYLSDSTMFGLYESSDRRSTRHCLGRHPDRYVKFVESAGWEVKDWIMYSHFIHGAQHSLTVIQAKKIVEESVKESEVE